MNRQIPAGSIAVDESLFPEEKDRRLLVGLDAQLKRLLDGASDESFPILVPLVRSDVDFLENNGRATGALGALRKRFPSYGFSVDADRGGLCVDYRGS